MINFIHADEAGSKFKHVIPEGNNDELGVLGAFFDIIGDDGDLYIHTRLDEQVPFLEKRQGKKGGE